MEKDEKIADLIAQIGRQNIANLITGCDRLTRLLGELPLLERQRLRILLNDVIDNEAGVLPGAALFVLETVAKGINAQEMDSVPNPTPPDKDTH